MHPPASVFEQTVSKPRLDSYRNYWKVGAEEAVGLARTSLSRLPSARSRFGSSSPR